MVAYLDGFPSGQRGQTVNLLQFASVVRIHLHPLNAGVAELADAQDLKSCGTYTPVPVRFRSPAFYFIVREKHIVYLQTDTCCYIVNSSVESVPRSFLRGFHYGNVETVL